MDRLLILGIGNPMRGDDALGPLAADALERRLSGCALVTVRAAHQLTPDLAALLHEHDAVILIDARASNHPGECFMEWVEASDALPSPFSHHISPGQLLAITSALYGSAPPVLLAGITAATFEFGAPLAPEISAALPDLLDRIMTLALNKGGLSAA